MSEATTHRVFALAHLTSHCSLHVECLSPPLLQLNCFTWRNAAPDRDVILKTAKLPFGVIGRRMAALSRTPDRLTHQVE